MTTKRSTRSRQTQLGFTPLPASSSPASDGQQQRIPATVAIADYQSPPATKKRRTLRDYLPTPSASSQPLPLNDGEGEHRSSPTPHGGRRRVTRGFMAGKSQSQGQSLNTPAADKSGGGDGSSNRKEPKENELLDMFDDSESETAVMQSSPMRKASSSRGHRRQRRRHSIEVVSSDDEEDDPVRSSANKGRRKVVVLADSDDDRVASPVEGQSRRKGGSGGNEEPAEDDDGNEDEVQDDDEDEDLPVRRNRRVLCRPSITPKEEEQEDNRTHRDKADLDEDLNFLGQADTDSPRASRKQSTPKVKSARQLALEKLKNRRRGRGDTQTGQSVVIDDEEDDDDTEEGYDYLNDDPFEGNEDDFVVEDDGEGPLGEPVQLPLQFSHLRTQKPKELFKYAVEWMVQKKINPAFAMDDEVYQIAFARLDDFVRGMGDSKFQSSAWTPTFSKMLRTRPMLKDVPLGGTSLLRDRCDACNRSGHPATWEVQFLGKTYNRRTMEEDSDDESEDDEENEEEINVFYIGKFCMRNARTAHALAHWQYRLKEWVVDHLISKGELSPEKIVRRDGWGTNKRRRDAERIVDEMERDGEIKALHRDFRNEIKDAHYSQSYSGRDMSSP